MTHTSKLPPAQPERTVTLSIRVPVSLAERMDAEVARVGGDMNVSELVRLSLEKEVTRRERRTLTVTGGSR